MQRNFCTILLLASASSELLLLNMRLFSTIKNESFSVLTQDKARAEERDSPKCDTEGEEKGGKAETNARWRLFGHACMHKLRMNEDVRAGKAMD